MPPEQRPIPRFIAEPPQEGLPYGRWAQQLAERFQAACEGIDTEGEPLGNIGEVSWFPDRTYAGRTYIPATASTSEGLEVLGYVSYARDENGEPRAWRAAADWTDETADANPDWKLDLSDLAVGRWRAQGLEADVALVWGVALVPGGGLATAELGPTTTDQCEVVEERFTLISLDSWTGDYLEVRLFGRGGGELAVESLYDEEG